MTSQLNTIIILWQKSFKLTDKYNFDLREKDVCVCSITWGQEHLMLKLEELLICRTSCSYTEKNSQYVKYEIWFTEANAAAAAHRCQSMILLWYNIRLLQCSSEGKVKQRKRRSSFTSASALFALIVIYSWAVLIPLSSGLFISVFCLRNVVFFSSYIID